VVVVVGARWSFFVHHHDTVQYLGKVWYGRSLPSYALLQPASQNEPLTSGR
jgi:hypothetical protein